MELYDDSSKLSEAKINSPVSCFSESVVAIPLGVIHFCVRFFSNGQIPFAGGWVGYGQVAVQLEIKIKYVHPKNPLF